MRYSHKKHEEEIMSTFKFLSKDSYKSLKTIGGEAFDKYTAEIDAIKTKFSAVTKDGKLSLELSIAKINASYEKEGVEHIAIVVDPTDTPDKLEWLRPFIPKTITMPSKMADNLAKDYNFGSFFELSLLLNAADKGTLKFEFFLATPDMEYSEGKHYECPHFRTENAEIVLSEFTQDKLARITMNALQTSMTQRVLNRGKKAPRVEEDDDNIESPV